MTRTEYQYSVCLYTEDQRPLGVHPVEVDAEPLVEAVILDALRRGRLDPDRSRDAPRSVEPVWLDDTPPWVARLRARVGNGEDGLHRDYPLESLRPAAEKAAAGLLTAGRLEPGQPFLFLVRALRREPPAASSRFGIKSVGVPWPIRPGAELAALREASVPVGRERDEDLPVFLAQPVLDEVEELTVQAGGTETGGVLIGHLNRDRGSPELYLEVTAQIPAPHTVSGSTKLTFTDRTWSAVRSAIGLRGKDEISLGWWHSHSYLLDLCGDCEKARDGSCRADPVFLSPEDRSLTRALFPRAYGLALVVGNGPCRGLTWGLFGWRDGSIMTRPRGLRILAVRDAVPVRDGTYTLR